MSHVEEVEIECRDLNDLKEAVQRRGGEFLEGQVTHAWWGRYLGDSVGMRNNAADKGRDAKTFGKCLHAIRVAGTQGQMGSSGPWEIGVVRSLSGDGYSLVYDNFGTAGQALEKVFGRDAVGIKDELAAGITMRELLRDGYRLNRTVTDDGSIVLEATR